MTPFGSRHIFSFLMVRDRPITINRTFFYIAMFFMFMGLAQALVFDITAQAWLIVICDICSLAFMGICFRLVQQSRVDPALMLVFCTILAALLYYFSFFVTWGGKSQDPRIWDDVVMNLLITGILGATAGLVLYRYGAWYFSALIIGFITALLTLPGLADNFGRVIFMGLLLLGTLLVVYYFRDSLEKLMAESSQLIAATRSLKEKQERQNEVDRPFMYFGQNSVGLVMDFRTDVTRMLDHLKVLKLEGLPGDEQLSILQNMDEEARSLSRRIDLVTFITSAGPERPPELLRMRQVFESALYPFRINPGLKSWLTVSVEAPADLDTWDRRYHWLRMIEIIMRQTLRPENEHPEHLQVTWLLTGNREGIRIAYQESRPFFSAVREQGIRSRFQSKPLDILLEIMETLGGHLEFSSVSLLETIIHIPRRYRS